MPIMYQTPQERANAEARWKTLDLIQNLGTRAGQSIQTAQEIKLRNRAVALDEAKLKAAQTQQRASIMTGDLIADQVLNQPQMYGINQDQAQVLGTMLKSGSDEDRMQGIRQVNDLMKNQLSSQGSGKARDQAMNKFYSTVQMIDQARLSGDEKTAIALSKDLDIQKSQLEKLGSAEQTFAMASQEPYTDSKSRALFLFRTNPEAMTEQEMLLAQSALGLLDNRPPAFDAMVAARAQGIIKNFNEAPEVLRKNGMKYFEELRNKKANASDIPIPTSPSKAQQQSGAALRKDIDDLLKLDRE